MHSADKNAKILLKMQTRKKGLVSKEGCVWKKSKKLSAKLHCNKIENCELSINLH